MVAPAAAVSLADAIGRALFEGTPVTPAEDCVEAFCSGDGMEFHGFSSFFRPCI